MTHRPNFWSEGGNAGFSIENLSDDIIYMDLEKTFYINNGKAYDYYQARDYSIGKDIHVSKGESTSATTFGLWRPWSFSGYLGSTAAQSLESVSVGSGTNLTFKEKPVVAIPPYASKTFSEYIIMKDVIQDCSVSLMVNIGKTDGRTYTETESPINFTNYITYKKGDNGTPQIIINDFYIAGYNNYVKNDIVKTTKVGCKESHKKDYNEKSEANRFYVKYDNSHANHYSADAIVINNNSAKTQNKEDNTKGKYSYW